MRSTRISSTLFNISRHPGGNVAAPRSSPAAQLCAVLVGGMRSCRSARSPVLRWCSPPLLYAVRRLGHGFSLSARSSSSPRALSTGLLQAALDHPSCKFHPWW